MVIGANSLGTEATRTRLKEQAEAFQYYTFRMLRVGVPGLGSEGTHFVGYTGCVDALTYYYITCWDTGSCSGLLLAMLAGERASDYFWRVS